MNKYNISILKTPTNKFIFVGNVPITLCDKIEKRTLCGGEYKSKVFNTIEEAQNFLNEVLKCRK
jgi:hypothetical protein